MCDGLGRIPTPDLRWLRGRRTRVDSLERHRELVRGCARCFLDEGNAPVVDVVKDVRVLLVGQGPGLTEVATRLPFTGPAGRRLGGWCSEAGVSRAEIYLSALIRCLSGKPRGGGDKVPSRAILANCRPHLLREFGLFRPEVVIPVGGWLQGSCSAFVGLGGGRRDLHTRWGSICPLPHPSGASTWLHMPENRSRLLSRARGRSR